MVAGIGVGAHHTAGCSTPGERRRVAGEPARSDEAEAAGAGDRVGTGGHAELAVQALGITLDGVERQVQLGTDLTSRQGTAQGAQDSHLTVGEILGQPAVGAGLAHRAAADTGLEGGQFGAGVRARWVGFGGVAGPGQLGARGGTLAGGP